MQATATFEFYATEHFRLSGVYWGLTALHLVGQQDRLDKEEILRWVLSCQKQGGGFGGSPRHDAHLLHTLSAIQVLAVYDRLDLLDAAQVAACEAAVQQCCVTILPGARSKQVKVACRCCWPTTARWLLLWRRFRRDRHQVLDLVLLCTALQASAHTCQITARMTAGFRTVH